MKLWILVVTALAGLCATVQAQPDATAYGAWGVECSAAAGSQTCQASQVVATDPAGRNVAVGVIVTPGDPGQAPLITFRFSKLAYVPAGAGLKIDDNEPLRAPITACDDKVCEVRARLTDDLAGQMRQGKTLIFAYFLDKERQVSFPVSLDGFIRSLQAVTTGKH